MMDVNGCRQALADRFVEAFAERLHADMRRQIWGYAPEEKASDSLVGWTLIGLFSTIS